MMVKNDMTVAAELEKKFLPSLGSKCASIFNKN
jgi:hypothetical protein